MFTDSFKTEYLAARRAWLENFFSDLNPMQRQAVLTTQGPVLILAGAGSGKTTVLIQRIVNLLRFGVGSDSDELPEGADEEALRALKSLSPEAEEHAVFRPVPPWKILAITFTNKAADELKARLAASLKEGAEDIWACTFHSACLRILRRDAELLGYTSGFSIYDTNDSLSMIKRILKDQNLDEKAYPPRSILSAISRVKDEKILPEEFASNAKQSRDSRSIRIAEIYKEYAKRLFSSNAMDFDDLILNTVLMLERFEDRRSYWQQRFAYIMVDEYQDTNHLQYLLISLLAGSHHNLCVVGDDDQSIYRFRGATIENILSFEKQFSGCRTVRLEENYRSTEQILEAANNVIRHNRERKGKELWTGLGRGDPVQVFTALNEYDESAFIANSILTDFSHGMRWKDHAILYRKNALSRPLENAMTQLSIPYRIFGGARFFDRAEVKDVLSYLCVVADPKDELRLTRIINVPARGIGEKSVETAHMLALQYGVPLFEIFQKAEDYPELSRPALRMRQFAGLIRDLQDPALSCSEIYDAVLEKTGYLCMLEESKDEKNQTRAENIRELKNSILAYEKETGDSSLEGYLSSIALYTDIDGMDREEDSVVMMTIHSAKGLEFPIVYVVGLEEGIFPGLRSIGEQTEMEEERRLCYVAFTRAKNKLILSHAKQRMDNGRTTANRTSRFLEEAELLTDDSPFDSFSRSRGQYETQGHDGSGFTGRIFGSNRYPSRASSAQRKSEKRPGTLLPAKAPEPLPELSPGLRVTHNAFGEGTVLKLTPMGGDQLVELEFDKVGKKKLMLKAAARYLKIQ